MRRFLPFLLIAACSHRASPPKDAAPDVTVVDASDDVVDASIEEAAPKIELPRGGRELFPTYRLVGYCGTPGGAPALGRLAGNLDKQAKAIEGYAAQYAGDRKTMPVFELIVVVVTGLPGPDDKFRRRVPDNVVDDYLKAARDAKAVLLLNIQPGHSDFMTEIRHYENTSTSPTSASRSTPSGRSTRRTRR